MAIEDDKFRTIFHESRFLEWKEGFSANRIQAVVVGFSNADGGVIQIGVANDGRIVGRTLDASTELKLHEIIAPLRNPGRYSIHQLVVGAKTVVVVSVEKRHEGFAQMPNGHVLVRSGPSNVGLFGQDLVNFIGRRALTRFEINTASLPLNAVDPALLDRVADAFGWTDPSGWNDRLVEHGLAKHETGDPVLTVAGALLLARDLPATFDKAHVEVFRYPTPDDETYDKRIEIRGPLDEQIESAARAVEEEIGTDQVVLGTHRHDLPRLPLLVVREAIANAVAHRSYENNRTTIRISIYPDEVVIRSPGAFPEPVTEENIRDTQAARNPAIISVLRRLRLAEDAGLGVDRMQDTMKAEMLEPPRFNGLDFAVEVGLPLTGTVAPRERAWVREVERRGEIQASDRVVLIHSARGEVLTNARVRELLNVDSVEARQALQRLRDAGFLRQTGERGGSQYFLADGLSPPAGLRLNRVELKRLVVTAATQGPITNRGVRESTGLSREEVKLLLRELVEEDRLVLSGKRRGAHYVLPEATEQDQLPLATSSPDDQA